jgi:hypothetical protein
MEIAKSRNQLVVDLSNHQKDNIGTASSLSNTSLGRKRVVVRRRVAIQRIGDIKPGSG